MLIAAISAMQTDYSYRAETLEFISTRMISIVLLLIEVSEKRRKI